MKLLLVEDDAVDRMAFERFVRQSALPYEYVIADSVASAKEALAGQEFEVILLDYSLGDGTAFDILDLSPDAPVILITGASQIDLAVAAMKSGAYDYLVKDQDRDYLHVLPHAVDSAVRLREVEATSRILSHALMSAPDSVFITDLGDAITMVNTAALDTYGYAREELLGQHIGFIGDVGPDGEYAHRRSDGSEFPVLLSGSAVEDGKGNEIARVLMVRDVTEQKLAEEELRRINRELDGFAHTVSHDLKGPLSSTMLAASTLEKLLSGENGPSSLPQVDDLLEVIDRNVWKSASLIDDLLALAEAGQVPRDVEEVDVRELVDRIVEEDALLVGEKAARMAVGEDLGRLLASPTHMYQLFANLIGNCLKHNRSETPEVRVERLQGTGSRVKTYLVRDNGEGIPPEDLTDIFAPFFKGRSGGTGIGLATVNKIVKLYGGDIRAYNDGGACFEFSIRDWHPPAEGGA